MLLNEVVSLSLDCSSGLEVFAIIYRNFSSAIFWLIIIYYKVFCLMYLILLCVWYVGVTVSKLDVESHLARYAIYDQSPGAKDGIPLATALSIPEFASNALYPRILQMFIDAETGRLSADRFLQLCALMSSSMPAAAKKQCTLLAFTDHFI